MEYANYIFKSKTPRAVYIYVCIYLNQFYGNFADVRCFAKMQFWVRAMESKEDV